MTEDIENTGRFINAVFRLKKMLKPHTLLGNINLGDMSVFWCMRRIIKEESNTSIIKSSKISDMLNISKPALTQIINRLEGKDLIERVYSKTDRRCTFLRFTKNGESIFEEEKNNMQKCLLDVENKMGKEKFIQLADLLEEFTYSLSVIKEEKNEKDLQKGSATD